MIWPVLLKGLEDGTMARRIAGEEASACLSSHISNLICLRGCRFLFTQGVTMRHETSPYDLWDN